MTSALCAVITLRLAICLLIDTNPDSTVLYNGRGNVQSIILAGSKH
jgi:hypothetical protein